jgi:hypothetical protein
LRVTYITLGAVALTVIVYGVRWLSPLTISLPSPPPTHGQRAAVGSPPPRPLTYRMDTSRLPAGAIGIVNQEAFAWTDVQVEIGEGKESFQCRALPTVGAGQTLTIHASACRSSDDRPARRVCVVRVTARQGGIVCAFEPCMLTPWLGLW